MTHVPIKEVRGFATHASCPMQILAAVRSSLNMQYKAYGLKCTSAIVLYACLQYGHTGMPEWVQEALEQKRVTPQ